MVLPSDSPDSDEESEAFEKVPRRNPRVKPPAQRYSIRTSSGTFIQSFATNRRSAFHVAAHPATSPPIRYQRGNLCPPRWQRAGQRHVPLILGAPRRPWRCYPARPHLGRTPGARTTSKWRRLIPRLPKNWRRTPSWQAKRGTWFIRAPSADSSGALYASRIVDPSFPRKEGGGATTNVTRDRTGCDWVAGRDGGGFDQLLPCRRSTCPYGPGFTRHLAC